MPGADWSTWVRRSALTAALLPALVLAGTLRGSRSMLDSLDAREAVEDTLEPFLDGAICKPLVSGRRVLSAKVVARGVVFPAENLVQIAGCTVRPLRLEPTAFGARAHLYWELEGRDASGARRTERGESDAVLQHRSKGWFLESLQPLTRATAVRASPRFTEIAAASDLVVPTEPKTSDMFSTIAREMLGALAVRDFDGDGRPDVLVLNTNQAWMFWNLGGMKFRREAIGPPAPSTGWYSMALAGDLDNDGDPDLILVVFSPSGKEHSRVLRNERGKFSEVGQLPVGGPFISGVVADLNGDGQLDVGLLTYPALVSPPDDFLEVHNGSAPRFLIGSGDLQFREEAVDDALKKTHRRWGLAGIASDIDGTGRPQLYVANDYGSKDLWVYTEDAGFVERAAAMGLADPGNGMSVDLGDVNRDDRLDLYTANMFSKAGTRVVAAAEASAERKALLQKFAAGNTLYLSGSDGGFVESAAALGVNRGYWAFGSIFLDADDDGLLDIAVADGFISKPNRKDL